MGLKTFVVGREIPRNLFVAVSLSAVLVSSALPASAPFLRSDVNNDGVVDVSDAVFSLLVLFDGHEGDFSCDMAADVNDDGGVDVSDTVHALSFLFRGGTAPAPPYPACGQDPTDDNLWCLESACGSDELPSWLPQSPFDGQVVSHAAITLEYDEEHEQARWVAYYLSAGRTNGPVARTDDYRADPAVETDSARRTEYAGTGFDRGHLAPAGDMRWSEQAMSESFFMSNIAPQRPTFNRGVWVRLENQVRNWACSNGALHVVVGPVLEGDMEQIGPSGVSVPPAFYKVLLDYERGEAVGFVRCFRNRLLAPRS